MAEEKQRQDQSNLVKEENLKDVAGGKIFETPHCLSSYDEEHPYEVLDDTTGQPLKGKNGRNIKFATVSQAEKYCHANGIDTDRIYCMTTVNNARDAYNTWVKAGGDPEKFTNDSWHYFKR